MFAYCLNNPVVLVDLSGNYCVMYHTGQSAFDAMNGIVDAGGGGGGMPGVFTGGSRFIDTKATSFAVMSKNTDLEHGTATAELVTGSLSGSSLTYDALTLFSANVSLISCDFDLGNWFISPLDLVNAEFSASISSSLIPSATAMVSVWSPSVSYDFGDTTVTFGFLIGAVGVEFNPVYDNFKMGFADGFGFYISVS